LPKVPASVKCLRNGLWLCRTDALSCGVLLSVDRGGDQVVTRIESRCLKAPAAVAM